jgi:hypothetical protein
MPDMECYVAANMRERGMAYFLPLSVGNVKVGRRAVTRMNPVFDGYLFGYGDAYVRMAVRGIESVGRVFGDNQWRLERELNWIHAICTCRLGYVVADKPYLAGEQVEMISGPFVGSKCVLVPPGGVIAGKVSVSMHTLGNWVIAELDANVFELWTGIKRGQLKRQGMDEDRLGDMLHDVEVGQEVGRD